MVCVQVEKPNAEPMRFNADRMDIVENYVEGLLCSMAKHVDDDGRLFELVRNADSINDRLYLLDYHFAILVTVWEPGSE